MKRILTILLAAGLAVLLGIAAAACREVCVTPLAGFEPDPEASGGELGGNGAWTFVSGTIAARLTPLDDAGRLAFLREETGAAADPFASRPGEPPPFITFHLVVANASPHPVSFEPQMTWLVPDKGSPRLPLDRITMGSAYRVAEADMPPAYEQASKALLSGVSTISHGGKVAGLLVFQPIGPKAKAFRVEIRLTDHMAESVDFHAAYRKTRKSGKMK